MIWIETETGLPVSMAIRFGALRHTDHQVFAYRALVPLTQPAILARGVELTRSPAAATEITMGADAHPSNDWFGPCLMGQQDPSGEHTATDLMVDST